MISTHGSLARLFLKDSRTKRFILDLAVDRFTTLFGIARPKRAWRRGFGLACQVNGPL